jgi:hypothetical protein
MHGLVRREKGLALLLSSLFSDPILMIILLLFNTKSLHGILIIVLSLERFMSKNLKK